MSEKYPVPSVNPNGKHGDRPVTRDLQGSKIINGKHEDLVNNPSYGKRYEEAVKSWKK